MAQTIGQVLINVAADTQELRKGMRNAEKTVSQATKKMGMLVKTAFAAVAIRSIKDLISVGFDYNSQMEESQNAITSIINATSSLVDSEGNLLTVQERLNMAQRDAAGIVDKLNKVNEKTPQSLADTNKIFSAMLPSMRALGVGYDDLIKVTEQVSIAAGAAGIGTNQLLAGVDGLASGTVLASSDLGRFFSSIGLTNEALKNTTNITQLLDDKLSGFKSFGSMAEAASNLKNAFSNLMGVFTKSAFENSKKGIKSLTDSLNTFSKDLPLAMQFSIVTVERMMDLFNLLWVGIKVGFQGIKPLFETGFLTLLSNLQFQFADFADGLSDVPGLGDGFAKMSNTLALSGNRNLEIIRNTKTEISGLKAELNAAIASASPTIEDRMAPWIAEQSAIVETAEKTSLVGKAVEEAIVKTEKLKSSTGGVKVATSELVLAFEELTQTIGGQLENSMTSTFRSWMDGAVDFKDLMGNILKDIAAELMRVLVIKQAVSGITGFVKDMTQGPVQGPTKYDGTFASGGVVNSPTSFNYDGGKSGLMGEAGAEAIMPLTRIGGDLGVKAVVPTVNIINNASSEVEVSQSKASGDNIDIMIEKKVKSMFGTGSMDKTLNTNYGLKRNGF